jgi:hypothetical protein
MSDPFAICWESKGSERKMYGGGDSVVLARRQVLDEFGYRFPNCSLSQAVRAKLCIQLEREREEKASCGGLRDRDQAVAPATISTASTAQLAVWLCSEHRAPTLVVLLGAPGIFR